MTTRPILARSSGARLILALAVGFGAFSCRDKPTTASGGPAGSASVRPAPSECRRLRSVLVLGKEAARQGHADEEGEVDTPFLVELGEARVGTTAFAVPGLENRGGGNYALIALADAASGEGRIVELGRVYGDVEPPVLAPHQDRWLIASSVADASGLSLRLNLLTPPFGAKDLSRGAEVAGLRRDAPSVALAMSGEHGLLAWNTLEKGRARLAVAAIDPKTALLRGKPAVLPLADAEDAEAPRLAPRPSGHYLAYLVRTPVKSGRPLRTEDGVTAEKPEELVQEGPSGVEIVPLDAQGVPVASARRLTPAGGHVLAFDVAPLMDGGALVVYRETAGPGRERPSVQAVRVRPDGAAETRTWEVGDYAGIPTVLVDSAPVAPDRGAMVALAGEGRTQFTLLGADPLALGALREDAVLGSSEPLALRGGRLLAALSRGTQRELSLLECGPPPSAR